MPGVSRQPRRAGADPTPLLFTADAGSGVRGWKVLYQHGRSFAGEGIEGYAENAAFNDLGDTLPPVFTRRISASPGKTELTAPETGAYALVLSRWHRRAAGEWKIRLPHRKRRDSPSSKVYLHLTKGEVVAITLRHSKSDNATYVKFGWTRPGSCTRAPSVTRLSPCSLGGCGDIRRRAHPHG